MEGTETILFFIVMILVPAWFPPLAYVFAGLRMSACLVTVSASSLRAAPN
jgi:hypothetical protein